MLRLIGGVLVFAVLVGCAATPATDTPPTASSDHAAHGGHSMAGGDEPYDARFLDSMIIHHQGALTMAQAALQEAQRPELRAMATAIIDAQEAEIAQMQAWRAAWYPDLPPTAGMTMDMGPMDVANDPATPFDIRFIEAMVPHHEGAVSMAEDALVNAEHSELKELAETIIATQQAEITQMRAWQAEWLQEGASHDS